MERALLGFAWLLVIGLTMGSNLWAQGSLPGEANGLETAVAGVTATSTDWAIFRQELACGNPAAHELVVELAVDANVPTRDRVDLLALLSQFGQPGCVPRVLGLLSGEEQPETQLAALQTLSRFQDPQIPAGIFQEYPHYSAKLKRASREVLFGHKGWALAFLERVDRKQFSGQFVSIDELRRLERLSDEPIHKLVLKHWGRVSPGLAEEKQAKIRRWSNDLRILSGDAEAGKTVFRNTCARCHRIFGEGETIGPDLTVANRKDREYVLTSLVDPSDYIRADYLTVQVVTRTGRILQGLVFDEDERSVTLVDSNGERTKTARNDIEEMVPSQISRMPEGLLKPLSPQQVRDLVAFLESDRESTGGEESRTVPRPPPL